MRGWDAFLLGTVVGIGLMIAVYALMWGAFIQGVAGW